MECNETCQNNNVSFSPAQAEHKQKATTAMALSIVGLCIFFLPVANIVGFVLSIIGFVKSRDNRKFAMNQGIVECNENTAGYICGLIGIILGAIGVLVTILIIVAIFGFITIAATSTVSTLPEIIEEVLPAITAGPAV